MVKKGSKRGLNTGNTIRHYHRDPVLREYQRYGCLVIDDGISVKDKRAAKVMKDVVNVLPPTSGGLELSLNKQRRWELPSHIKNKINLESGSRDVQITVLEHTINVPNSRPINEWETCTSFYSNVGPVQKCVSNTEMNIKSAKQGYRECDHLSRLERRAYKKMRTAVREGASEDLRLPLYECHVAYGARTDGKFYKELATKGFAQTSKKNRNHTAGCSKRFQDRTLILEEDDLALPSDEDICGAETRENPSYHPITVSLGQFLTQPLTHSKHSKLSRKARRSSFVMV